MYVFTVCMAVYLCMYGYNNDSAEVDEIPLCLNPRNSVIQSLLI